MTGTNSSFSGISIDELPSVSFQIAHKIASSRFPVYLLTSPQSSEKFALKLFHYAEDKPQTAFLNESRFTFLNHENVIEIKKVEKHQKTIHRNKNYISSYLVMEYAPYGNFAGLIPYLIGLDDEKLVRTYFHQLIEGIEYLHQNSVAHMDLKLENILLGQDFKLKICDFDIALWKNQYMLGKGTRNYRAPEIQECQCSDPYAADIYSAGVILFLLMTGCFPYVEGTTIDGKDFYELLKKGSSLYWKFIEDSDIRFSEDLKTLFSSMVKADPIERATISEVKMSKWYLGEVYNEQEYADIMSSLF